MKFIELNTGKDCLISVRKKDVLSFSEYTITSRRELPDYLLDIKTKLILAIPSTVTRFTGSDNKKEDIATTMLLVTETYEQVKEMLCN